MAFVAYSARNAKVRYGAFTLTAHGWTVEPKAARIKTTNFESNGYEEGITGIRSVTWTIELDDNGLQNTFDIPITVGMIFTSTLSFYLNALTGTTGPFWSISGAHIESITQKAAVEDAMKLTISGSGNAAWVYPTSSAGTTAATP